MTTKSKQKPTKPFVCRALPLEDIAIRSGSDGRTVEAYATVFGVPAVVTDFYRLADSIWDDDYGTYEETIRQGCFTKTLQENERNVQCIYNHGKDLYGNPAERYALPLGMPLEIKQDSKGLFTVVRYSKTALADEILELVKDGAIRAMSVGGRFITATITRATADGELDKIERVEMSLKEFGPCTFPAYTDAVITGVRMEAVVEQISHLDEDERKQLATLLGTRSEAAPTGTSDEPPASPDTTTEPPASTPEGPSLSMLEAANAQRQRRAL